MSALPSFYTKAGARAAFVNNTAEGRKALAESPEVSGSFAPVLDGGEAVSRRLDHLVSARTFGAVGDGATDDTAALQAFLNFVVANKRNGFLPRANYRITSTLVIPSGPGWTLTGNGNRGTLITQDADNVPVIQLGHEVGTQLHHFRIADLWLTYKNAQPAANTAANGLYVYDMIWQGRIERVGFKRGFYGIKVRPGTGNPWGQTWDDLHFGDGLTGGAIDWTGGVNQTPNNVWGRFYVEIGAMVGPVFANVRGYDWIWHSTEFIQATTDLPKLITFADGTHVEMGAFKVENSPLTTAKQLIEVAGNSKITIGHIFWTGGGLGIPAISSGAAYLFSVGSSGAGDSLVEIGEVTMQLTADYLSQPLYLFRRGHADVQFRVRRLRLKNGWKAINFDASPVGAVADSLWVDEWVNNRMVAKGDADVTVALGNPNIMRFATAFTAPRTITLPADKTSIHSGMYYDLIFDGAINGSNTVVIKAGSTTLRTQTTDKVRLRFTWQVDSSASAGWKLTAYATMP